MGKSVVVTTRLDTELATQFDALASQLGRSRAALLAEAARSYAEEQAAFLAFMDRGERDIDEGRSLSAEEARSWLSEMREDARLRASQQKAA